MSQPMSYPQGPYAPPPPSPVQSLQVLSILAIVTTVAFAATTALASLAFFAVIDDYRQSASLDRSAWDTLTWADAVAVPAFLFMVAAYVCNCLWLGRARSNVVALSGGEGPHARSKIWVWLGWWVPIVSLWFPYQVVRDIWAESTAPQRLGAGIGGWWTAWLIGMGATQAHDRLLSSRSPLTDGTIDVMAGMAAVSAISMVVGAVLWIRLVVRISRAQVDRAARQGLVLT